MEVPEPVQEKVESLAESEGLDLERAEEVYEKAYEEVAEQMGDEVDDETIARTAFGTYRADVMDIVSGAGTEINFVAVGHTGVQMWPVRDSDGNLVDSEGNQVNDRDDAARKEVLIGHGLVDAPHDDMGVGKCSFILDSRNGVDISNAMDLFTPLTGIKGTFSVNDVDAVRNQYIAWSGNNTSLEEAYDDFPNDKETLRGLLHEKVEKVEIATIRDSLSATEVVNDRRRTAGFGCDFKRINGEVQDAYLSDDGDTATYTILDDSVLPDDVRGDEAIMGESQRKPGFTCWATEDKMEYGVGTQGEFYGPIRKNGESGQISMDLDGIIPTFSRPFGGNGSEADGNTETDSF